MSTNTLSFWEKLDRDFRRTQRFIEWKINGQFVHGIAPLSLPSFTAERAEEIYNVDFGN